MNVYETRRTKLKCLVLGAAGAGKTSILRRYFCNTFEAGVRVPTKGSDFYVGKLTEPLAVAEDDNDDDGTAAEDIEVTINLQMWDTPGRERFYYYKNHQRKPPSTTASLADPFLTQADACMLVYDMTSSTSFTQLLRWYADLMEILQNHSKQKDNHNNNHQYHTVQDFPILIVGNKLDLFQATQQRATTWMHPRRVPQRDVLGLQGKDFKGKDFQYEYRVSPIKSPRLNNNNKSKRPPRHGREPVRQEVSSFLANRENWTKDNSYLDSLLNSEDQSGPDRDMVLLWCMRNGLEHLEVSAATGEGVHHAIVTLARMALERKLEMEYQQQEELLLQQQQEHQSLLSPNEVLSTLPEEDSATPVGDPSLQAIPPEHHHQTVLDVHRPKLDLQERYRSKDKCCFGLMPPFLSGLFRK